MVRLIPIEDTSGPQLAEFARLRDSQLRVKLEGERGLFVAEGEKIIRRAAEAGCRPSAFLLTERWRTALEDVLDAADAPCYVGTEAMIEAVSGFHVHRGALATFHRPEPPSWEQLLDVDRIIITQSLVDHANLGSIIRIGTALGWGGLAVSQTCADPLYRRSIKASMGSSLQLPWRRMTSDLADLRRIKEAGFTIVATTLGEGATPLQDIAPGPKLALLLGNEGHGLPDAWQDAADVRATIPMAPGIDSLNVAAAAAIFAHALRSPGLI